MKKEYDLIRKPRGFLISSINDQSMHFSTDILAGKIIRSCWVDEVPMVVVSLAAQCNKGVQFNWKRYFCQEFLDDYQKA